MNNFFSRMIKYLNQMFPPLINIPGGLLAFFAPLYVYFSIVGVKEYSIIKILLGGLTYILIMLLLRLMDEIKDYEIDCRLFKDRPLVTGVITFKDIYLSIGFIKL